MNSHPDFKEMQTVAALVQYGGVGQVGLHYQAILAIYEGPVRRMVAEAERHGAVAALRELLQREQVYAANTYTLEGYLEEIENGGDL